MRVQLGDDVESVVKMVQKDVVKAMEVEDVGLRTVGKQFDTWVVWQLDGTMGYEGMEVVAVEDCFEVGIPSQLGWVSRVDAKHCLSHFVGLYLPRAGTQGRGYLTYPCPL